MLCKILSGLIRQQQKQKQQQQQEQQHPTAFQSTFNEGVYDDLEALQGP